MPEASGDAPILIIGAGPAGLTAGYLLSKEKRPVIVLEANPTLVGGIARTVLYKGFRLDIGGHRFYSKSAVIENLWTEMLPDDLLVRQRVSHILYRGTRFSYPLKPLEALVKLGGVESVRCLASYFYRKLFPIRSPVTFQDWVTNRFGKRLFQIFFQAYTEKVWGMRCDEISADWAEQRIQNLTLFNALKRAILQWLPSPAGNGNVKTLVQTFRYPRQGPGMLWEACAKKITDMGGQIRMDARVHSCRFDETRKKWQVTYQSNGKAHRVEGSAVISSIPIAHLIPALEPKPSTQVRIAAASLRYRDFLMVALIGKAGKQRIEDNWIYIHDPGVRVARIQNFAAWSPQMCPDPSLFCYGMEYFCQQGDSFWNQSDAELIAFATAELQKTGLAPGQSVIDGCVVRQTEAYPVYDDSYLAKVALIRTELEQRFPSLYLTGRAGMHKYNNQDHSMMTALLSVENIKAGYRAYDVWQVNEDAEYLESSESRSRNSTSGMRQVPRKIDRGTGNSEARKRAG